MCTMHSNLELLHWKYTGAALRFVEAAMFPASYLNTVVRKWLETGHILAYCQRRGTLHQRSENEEASSFS